jgi:hypothetical protein
MVMVNKSRSQKILQFNFEQLLIQTRVPNGYPKDHPQAEHFKQRDWLIAQDLPDKRLSYPHLGDWVLSVFEKTKDSFNG